VSGYALGSRDDASDRNPSSVALRATPSPNGRRPRAAFIAAGLTLALAGCFQPLYGGAGGAQLQADLAAIAIDPIPERLGHYLGNELSFALNGTGSTVAPKYRLTITPVERVQSPVIDTISGRATAGTIVVDAEYRLTPIAGGAPITQGVAFSAASYDRTSQRFANIRAARDAEIRDAKALSDQIRTRLAAALSPPRS
jgi:LPS-assembly lipoprotein